MNARITILVIFICLCQSPGFSLSEKEQQFGYYTDMVFVSMHTLILDEDLNAKVNQIGNRVARAAGRDDIKYTFRIVNSPAINAHAAAGGYVYIHSGLMDILKSEDELASLIGHEIAHINNQHKMKFVRTKQAQLMFGEIAGNVLGSAMAGGLKAYYKRNPSVYYASPYLAEKNLRTLKFAGFSLVNMMAISMINGYHRDQELEADRLAVRYVAKAGYDPRAIINVFEELIKIRDRLKIHQWNYLSHLINAKPGLTERIQHIDHHLSNLE